MGGAAEIHPGIDHPVSAIFAAPGRFVFEEFHGAVTNRTRSFIDVSWFPITTILTRAFHESTSKRFLSLLMISEYFMLVIKSLT
jgi:hypothetical protein